MEIKQKFFPPFFYPASEQHYSVVLFPTFQTCQTEKADKGRPQSGDPIYCLFFPTRVSLWGH